MVIFNFYIFVILAYVVVCIIALPALIRPKKNQTKQEKENDFFAKTMLILAGWVIFVPYVYFCLVMHRWPFEMGSR